MATEELREKTAAELVEELKYLFLNKAESKVVDHDRRDTLLEQLSDALTHVPSCALKLKPHEPGFTLRGQDLTSDLLVEVWAVVNGRIRHLMNQGIEQEAALGQVRNELSAFLALGYQVTDKVEGALQTVVAMARYTPKKLAD